MTGAGATGAGAATTIAGGTCTGPLAVAACGKATGASFFSPTAENRPTVKPSAKNSRINAKNERSRDMHFLQRGPCGATVAKYIGQVAIAQPAPQQKLSGNYGPALFAQRNPTYFLCTSGRPGLRLCAV